MENDLEYRYERKFLIKNISYNEVIHIIKKNNAIFKELFTPRYINNIYFDDDKLSRFHDNVDGIAERQKVRVRWYGDHLGLIKNPVIEIKNRKNSVGTKLHYRLLPFKMDQNINSNYIKNVISQSDISTMIKIKMSLLSPKIFNGYNRRYFISKDKKFRVTLDKDLYYMKFNQTKNYLSNRILDRGSIVLEIKYDSKDDHLVSSVTNELGFRITKNSKYVNGIYAIYY